MTKKILTSPNRRINVTEIRIAPQATTRLSRKIGSAWKNQHLNPIIFILKFEYTIFNLTHEFRCTSMAAALQIRRVQSNRCWFFTTGNIFSVAIKNIKHKVHIDNWVYIWNHGEFDKIIVTLWFC